MLIFLGEVLSQFIPEIAAEHSGVSRRADKDTIVAGLPSWFVPVIAVDDLPDAYRGVPLRQDDSRAAIVAVWDPSMHAWMFAESRAMLFGSS